MLTLIRPAGPPRKRRPSVHRVAFNKLPAPPRLRLVGAAPAGPTDQQREILAIAVDRMIDDAMHQLTLERACARARLAATRGPLAK